MASSDSIFLVNGRGELEKIPYSEYENEDRLQKIVDKYPELLGEDQINPKHPPKWFVVKREAGIPGAEEEGSRWAVDHLFLDQYGRPTFIEVKRSKDGRIRREVVGQMLDYAANAQKYWPVDKIKTLSVEKYGSSEAVNAKLIEMLELDVESDPSDLLSDYWDTVEQNLRNGRVRLLFVADEIPSELRRIIEFLNDNMPLVDVLGVEIRRYQGKTIHALVPRVVGQTEAALQQKNLYGRSTKKTTKEEFLNDLSDEKVKAFFKRLFDESTHHGFNTLFGTKGFSIRVPLSSGQDISLFYGYPAGVNSSPVPIFQAYLAHIEEQQDRDSLQAAFSKHIHFVKKGEHTLEIRLDEEALKIVDEELSYLLQTAKAYSKGEQLELG